MRSTRCRARRWPAAERLQDCGDEDPAHSRGPIRRRCRVRPRAAVRRGRRRCRGSAADVLRRGRSGRRSRRAAAPRRAHVVLPLPRRDRRALGGRPPFGGGGPGRLRPLGQAVPGIRPLVRPPRRVGPRAGAGRARPARDHPAGSGLGRPDRAARWWPSTPTGSPASSLPTPACRRATSTCRRSGGSSAGRWRARSISTSVASSLRGACTGSPTTSVRRTTRPFPDESYKAGPRVMPTLVPTRPDDPATRGEPGRLGGAARVGEAVPGGVQRQRPDHPRHGPGPAQARARHRGACRHPVIAEAGHFLQEDAGCELGRIVADFVTSDCARFGVAVSGRVACDSPTRGGAAR